MSYGLKYRLSFDSVSDTPYEINILEAGYDGPVENRNLGSAPVLKMDDGEAVRGTSLELSIETCFDGDLREFYTTDRKKFRVEVYRSGVLFWSGHILPELYSEPYISVPFDVSVTASDGLGLLKNIPFGLSGKRSVFDVIKYCCEQTGLVLNYVFASKLLATGMSGVASVYTQAFVDCNAFDDADCYEALEKVLITFGSYIKQKDCKWHVLRYTDQDTDLMEYDPSCNFAGGFRPVMKTLGAIGDDTYPVGQLESEIVPARKDFTMEQPYELYPSLLKDYCFAAVGSWILSPGVRFMRVDEETYCELKPTKLPEKLEAYVMQSISVEACNRPFRIEFQFSICLMSNREIGSIDMSTGRSFRLEIFITDSGGTRHYLSAEGWGTKETYIEVRGDVQNGKLRITDGVNYDYIPASFETFRINLERIPYSGEMAFRIINPYKYYTVPGTPAFDDYNDMNIICLKEFVFTSDVDGNPDVNVLLNPEASTSAPSLKVGFVDAPFTENARGIFKNILMTSGGFTSEWYCRGSGLDSFANIALQDMSSRIGVPSFCLHGVIHATDFDLLSDKYSGRKLYLKEYSYDLMEEEIDCTLCELLPFNAGIDGEITQSPRSSNKSKTETRASGETEYRSYGGTISTPKMIRELVSMPDDQLSEGCLLEVDDRMSVSSKKVTVGGLTDLSYKRVLQSGVFWTKEEMNCTDGYLEVQGEKIKAGDSDKWNAHEFDDFLDQPVRKTDSVQFKQVTADKITTDEIISDNFVSGMIGGSGWSNYLDENGKSVAETDRAVFRDALVVPQITYNCIDVISGDKANTFAFGTIKSVDTASCTAELDLLDGQSGTLKVNDICRGVFHHFSGGNNTSDGTDTNGFLSYAGFTTVYFTPSRILLDEPGAMKFRYTLQPGTTAHPMAGMNFFAYGNFTDPDRQAMTYETRYYTRRLKCVDTWVIDPTRNISMQDGLLEGLRIGGMVMHGYGSFLENAYLTGVNIQFTPSQAEEMRGKSAYSVSLSSHERVVKLDDQGNLYSLHEELNVISGDGNVISGDENVVTTIPVLSTRIQAFRGETELLFTDAVDKDRYVVAVSATGCHASVSAGVLTVTEITDYEKCYVDLKINCEGNAVFDKRFSVVVVRDGADGNPGENAVMYRLQPSASVIRRDAAGNSDIASVSCRVMKTDGTLTTVSSLPWDYQMAYHIDGGREVRYVPEREIPVSGILKNILFRLYRNTQFVTMVDSEMIPVLTDGEGSITADLDDEMQSVACDSSGAVTSGLPLTATFLMYYGTTVLALDSLASGSVPSVTASASKSTGTITVTAIGVSAADTFRIPVTGKATHNGVQYKRTVYLTINKIRRGADGARTEIRYRYAFSKPAAPSGLNPAGWFPSPEPKELISIRHTGDFALADNMYVSPVPAADSATYKSRVTFTTSCDNQVIDLLLTVSSEAGRDFGMVCPVDAGYTADGPFLWRESGDAQTVLNLVVPTAGSHFIDIVYRKDAMGKAGGDFLKYRVIHPHTCWLSTVVIDPRTNDIPEWSAPVLFPTDTPGNEQVYLLAKSHIAADLPASDPYTDEYIGEAPAYDNTKTYVRGNIVRYNGSCKVCLSSCTGITPDMTPNWEPVGWWTDDPTGVGEAFPYEYQCSRRFTDGKWGDYGNRILFMHFGKDGEVPAVMQLVPSVTQIGRTMTGSWDPEVFSVTHRNSTGEAVAAWMAVWGSNGGNVWTRIGSVERVSSKTVSVAQYPYKYYMIRTYATSDVSFGSDYLLSVSVNVVSDGATGATGATGARGATGAMPVFRGFYKGAAEYTYTDTTRDIVNYSIDGGVFTFQVRVHGATVTTPPASSAGDANWEPANKFVFVAMDTALIDGANIAGFMYKNLRMVSRKGMLNGVETDIGDVPAEQFPGFEPHIAMDGNTGDAEFNRVLVRGSLCEPFELYQSEDEWRSGRSNNWLIRQRWWTSNYLVINAVPADEGKYVRIYNASLWSLTLLLYIYNGYNSYYWVTDDQAVVVIPPRAMLEMIAVKVSRENPDDGSVHDFCRWLITSRYSDGKTSTNQRQLTIKLPGE